MGETDVSGSQVFRVYTLAGVLLVLAAGLNVPLWVAGYIASQADPSLKGDQMNTKHATIAGLILRQRREW